MIVFFTKKRWSFLRNRASVAERSKALVLSTTPERVRGFEPHRMHQFWYDGHVIPIATCGSPTHTLAFDAPLTCWKQRCLRFSARSTAGARHAAAQGAARARARRAGRAAPSAAVLSRASRGYPASLIKGVVAAVGVGAGRRAAGRAWRWRAFTSHLRRRRRTRGAFKTLSACSSRSVLALLRLFPACSPAHAHGGRRWCLLTDKSSVHAWLTNGMVKAQKSFAQHSVASA
jgi:hypothetical protein